VTTEPTDNASGKTDFGSLHVGYAGGHLDPFHLDLESLTRGLAVVGQSGCGKSYFLARLLEEMILKGRPEDRFLVVDTNSDFRRGLSQAKYDLFIERKNQLRKYAASPAPPHIKEVLDAEEQAWEGIRNEEDFKEAAVFAHDVPGNAANSPKIAEFSLDWKPLLEDQRVLLRSLPTWREGTADYAWGLVWALHMYKSQCSSKSQTLESFVTYLWDLATDMTLSRSRVLEAGTERGLAVDVKDLLSSGEWRGDGNAVAPGQDLGLPEVLWGESTPRVNIIETETLENEAARLRVVLRSLEYLWDRLLEERNQALLSEENKPGRPAWFVFVEEAHWYAPAESPSPLAGRVSELLQKIAAEGRKYGLYLVLATQRPTKVARGLLGECDNAIIMKMNSRADLEYLANEMRILDVKLLETALHFQGKGNALAIGEAAGAAPNVVQFVMAPRRTAEGGGDLVRTPASSPGPPPETEVSTRAATSEKKRRSKTKTSTKSRANVKS